MPMPNENESVLRIGTLEDALPRRKRSLAPLSIAVHLAGLGALLLVPVLSPAELPEPTAGLRAFLVEPPSVSAPPPPPPPPAPAAAATRPTPRASEAPRFVAPVEVPESIAPEAGIDLGVEGGAPGGVEGGVEGGVVGGIIGGLPAAPPPPAAPVRVGGQIKEPTKLKHVAPDYPDLALQARVKGVVIVEALIGPDGRVNEVTVLQGVPLLDQAAVKAVRQWVYTPTLLNGIPVPVIMTVTLRFNFTA
jgi:periplasmic protein TonB